MSKWDLSVFYPNDEAWEKDFNLLKTEVAKFSNFKGKLGNFDDFLAYHKFDEEVTKLLYKVYAYAHLASDLNLKDTKKMQMNQQVGLVLSELNQLTSFISPEIIDLGKDTVLAFVEKDEFLKPFKFPYEKLFRGQEHILDAKSEQLMSNFSPIKNIPTSLYQALSTIDRKDETIKLSDGSDVLVTQAQFRALIEDAKTPEDRKAIFESLYRKYVDNKTAFAATYNLVLQSLSANNKNRGYASSLDAALFNNNIPTSVFHNLKDTAYENTHTLKRYIEIRKKALGMDEYFTYDRFLPLAKSGKKYPYDEAKALFLESIKNFPKEFVDNQKDAIKDGFVDAQPQDGKRSGAYSSGMYGHHPFILLNHNDTLDAVFTLAHEAGHSAHSIFSDAAQPMAISNYTIFVAEIASTFNEHALLDYLLEKSSSKQEKIELLSLAIDNIHSTFYRQTLFATYEYEANKLVSEGKPVNEKALSQIMIDLYQHYYGLDITKEPGKQYVWAYIPHLFYTPFYVYQYATAFSASLKIYDNVKSNEPKAFDNYIAMLKTGGSMYPVDEAKIAGADLTKKESFQAVVKRMESLLDQLEALLNE
ncbi:oligoendopeptidase F [Acholeplasma laidlawii]|uniref:Oligopeptidase F n=2 Tax=Acholeplasma laidlawii TaxID=2148 RepID=A9NHF0_ACHLI|nr:oligoendopeptidase F [Acholeplasma laidlawii]ABX81780.1 oligoendopeptidase F [Acholeplasma laidlawii PG-8A]NWH10767.1 oligoendopeptidase F [Acholeplasma laidlawii]NWH12152.1 oligoendopeptidase F [Acholeplasma laidlawii]NWH13538.1 oligoendopeptidase F [Acholeplasma laidlawii]NWH14295.1 oligoendopeptidase F [Acholeplasma laidlawii]